MYGKKGIILEPFRTKKLYEFEGTEMREVAVDESLWSLDDMARSQNSNLLFVLCERKLGSQSKKYIKILNLEKPEEQLCRDVPQGSQYEAKAIKVCPKDKIVGISHVNGELEIWRIDTFLNVQKPRPDKIFKNLCNSDFVLIQQGSQLYILSLLNIRQTKSDTNLKLSD